MISVGAIRDALWCLMAFGIVACAVAPLPAQKPATARAHEARHAQVAATLAALHPVRTARGIVLTLGDSAFDLGRAELTPGAVRSVDQLAQFLHEHPERRVLIEAFTDSRGSSVYNLELSQSRADSVAMLLIHRGIDARRMGAIGFGERFQDRNRRVEVTVTHGAEAIPYRRYTAAL